MSIKKRRLYTDLIICLPINRNKIGEMPLKTKVSSYYMRKSLMNVRKRNSPVQITSQAQLVGGQFD